MPKSKVDSLGLLKKTEYTIEINFSCRTDEEDENYPFVEDAFDDAVGFCCQSTGYGPQYRNVTYFFKDLKKVNKSFKRAIRVARSLIREGRDVQVQIHALMRG
jgi:hypothetical protein